MMALHPSLARLAGLALAAGLLALPPAAGAQSFRIEDVLQAEIRPGWREADGRHIAALHLRLAEGWKTYWRAPGDGGIAPRFDWAGSRNIASVRLLWPRPGVFDTAGIRTIGFADELVLPMEFRLTDAAAPARMETTVELGVCETICVPVTLSFAAELPAGAATGGDAHIRAALADRPQAASAAGLRGVSCEVSPIADGLRLTARLDLPALGGDEVVVFELSDRTVWISEAETRRDGGLLHAVADVVPTEPGFALDRGDLRITVLGATRAAELQGCPAPG
jgi:DsbC/DsbD-like thiol-disulfide interchange protein